MGKSYLDLKAEEIEYILVKTTSGGPFVEDVFFLVFAGESYWEIPQSVSEPFMAWLKTVPGINWNQMIKSMSSAEDRIFILYRGTQHPVLSEEAQQEMRERLHRFLSDNFEAPSEALAKLTENIFSSYEEDTRHYHNLEHLQHCLWELDQLSMEGKKELELAIWYHDIVYVAKSKTNEVDSAHRMRNELGGLATKINLEEVYQMIVASPFEGNLSERVKTFIDIDFSVLGQRELEYMAYTQNVRQEYSEVLGWKYTLARRKLLKRLLQRGIFLTQHFQNRYEAQAVKNISEEISKSRIKILN